MKYLIAILISTLALSACQDPGTTSNPVVVTKPADSSKPLAPAEQENTPGEESIVLDPVIVSEPQPELIEPVSYPQNPVLTPTPTNSSEPDLTIAPVLLPPAPRPPKVVAHKSIETTSVTVEAPVLMSVESTTVTVEAPKPVIVDAHKSIETTSVTVEAPVLMSVESTTVTVEAPKPVIVNAHKDVETTVVTLEAPKPVIVEAHKSIETTTVTLEAPKPVIVDAHMSVETTVVTLEAPKPVIVEAHKSIETTTVTLEAPKPVIVDAHMSVETTDVTVEAPVVPVEITAAPIEPATATPVPAAQNELEFRAEDLLGKGAFGEVYRGRYQGSVVAVKKFIPATPKVDKRRETLLQQFLQEALKLFETDVSNETAFTEFKAESIRRFQVENSKEEVVLDCLNQASRLFPVKKGKRAALASHLREASRLLVEASRKAADLKAHQEKALQLFQEEIRILADVRCPNIVGFCAATQHEGNQCLVMECAEFGALDGLLKKAKLVGEKFSETTQLHWCEDIAKGTQHLHERGIIHRDIKAANVLVFPETNSSKKYLMKLTDFGFALDTKTNKEGATEFCGSPVWMAPEIWARTSCSTKESDIYSYGMVAWEILSQQVPNFGKTWDEARIAIVDGADHKRQPFPKDAPKAIRELIIFCWKKDPNARPDAKQVVELLGERIQEISDAEAAAMLAAAQVQAPTESAPRAAEVLPEVKQIALPAPEVPKIEVAQPPAPKEPPVAEAAKPIAKLPTLGRLDTVFEWLERRVEGGATVLFGPQPQTPEHLDAKTFEVIQTNWWGRQEKRLLRVTKTHIERINPINGEVRRRVAIRRQLNRLEVSAGNDRLRIVFTDPQKGAGVADEYATSDANAIVESIKTRRPRIQVVRLQ